MRKEEKEGNGTGFFGDIIGKDGSLLEKKGVKCAEKTKMISTAFSCLKSLVTVKRTREVETEAKFYEFTNRWACGILSY